MFKNFPGWFWYTAFLPIWFLICRGFLIFLLLALDFEQQHCCCFEPNNSCCGSCSIKIGHVAASLASARRSQQCPTSCDVKNVSRHCQMSPGEQNPPHENQCFWKRDFSFWGQGIKFCTWWRGESLHCYLGWLYSLLWTQRRMFSHSFINYS